MTEPKKKNGETEREEEARRKRIEEKEKEWKGLLDESRQEEKKGVEETTPKTAKKEISPKTSSKLTLLIQVGMVILVSLVVCYFMVPRIAPSLSTYNTKMGEITASLSGLGGRIDTVQASIPNVSNLVTINAFNQETGILEDRISISEQDILNLKSEMASQIETPMAYNLTGTFGNYTLSIRAIEAGNYTARLTSVYIPARNVSAVNSTFEEALLGLNSSWLTSFDRGYIPSLVFDGQWKISQVSFLTDKFSLPANNLTSISITFTGLNVTPDYVFAEVFKVV